MDMEVDNPRRALVCDFLMKLYLEQCTVFRHYEVQRSTAATILTSICAALIGLAGVLGGRDGNLDKGEAPIAISIVLVSSLGLTVMWKLFERSRVSHSLSKAYLETLNAIMAPDVGGMVGEAVEQLPYVANARLNFVIKPAKNRPFYIQFPQGRRRYVEFTPEEFSDIISNHNPVYPQEIVYPVHNASMRFAAKWVSTWHLWSLIFVLFMCVGIYLSYDALN